MAEFNNLPVFPTPLVERGSTNKDWYFFFVGLFQGLAPEAEVNVPATGSPLTFSATRGGYLIVAGGTVSAIEFSRDGITFYTIGITNGIVPVCSSDRVRVTYSVAPTMTFVPT